MNIEINNGKKKIATGFFMKIKIKKKEMKCLITCEHVISQKDINDNIIINIYYGEDNKDSRQIKLDNKIRFMKVFDKDMTYIEVKEIKNLFMMM